MPSLRARLRTFRNGLLTMRPFIGRRVPRPTHPAGYWLDFDESFWDLGVVYRSQPGGHFHFMFLAVLNWKVGFYDTN